MSKTYSKEIVRALLDKKHQEFESQKSELENQIQQLRLEMELTKETPPQLTDSQIDLQAIEEELYK